MFRWLLSRSQSHQERSEVIRIGTHSLSVVALIQAFKDLGVRVFAGPFLRANLEGQWETSSYSSNEESTAMCHSSQSGPPAPPLVIPTDDHGPTTLTTTVGVVSPSFVAHPARDSSTGVIILPDVRGAHQFYYDLAVRFAEAGAHAVVIDYYGHLTPDPARGDDFEWQTKLPHVSAATVEPVVAAAVSVMEAHGVQDAFTVGFCFGGSQSWLLAASQLPLRGVIGFYGNPDLVQPRLGDLKLPMLVLVAGADVATSADRSRQFHQELAASGVSFEERIYEGAPHSFFDRSASDWHQASQDAWRRVLDFIAARSENSISASTIRVSAYATLDDVLPDLSAYARDFAHATINARLGLSKRDRELVILGALIALGDTGRQLRAHAHAAATHGVSVEELKEVILQTLPYAGFPRTINAALGLADQLRSANTVH